MHVEGCYDYMPMKVYEKVCEVEKVVPMYVPREHMHLDYAPYTEKRVEYV